MIFRTKYSVAHYCSDLLFNIVGKVDINIAKHYNKLDKLSQTIYALFKRDCPRFYTVNIAETFQ